MQISEAHIIKALEWCTTAHERPGKLKCNGCPAQTRCGNELTAEILNLVNSKDAEIKQKDAEIDILIRKNERLKDEVSELRAEVERLKRHNKEYGFCNLLGNVLVYSKNLKDYNDMRKGLKSEARKEFAERLKKKAASRSYCTIWESDVDEVFVEMESEQG